MKITLGILDNIMEVNNVEMFYTKRSAAYYFRDDAGEPYDHVDIEFIGDCRTISDILEKLDIISGNHLLLVGYDSDEISFEYFPSLEESVKHKQYTIDCIYKRVKNNHYIDTVGGIKDTIGMNLISPSTRKFEIVEDEF
mgnify:CR=1 FL=1